MLVLVGLVLCAISKSSFSQPESSQRPFEYQRTSPAIQAVTVKQWDDLKNAVGGRLLAAVPFARACFSDSNVASLDSFNSPQCLRVRNGYLNETLRSDSLGGYINTQWETCQSTGEQCLLDFTNPSNPAAVSPPSTCALGSVSNYFIDVREPEDVFAAFNFVRRTNVPLIIKNTGHDYKGRSSAPNSLGLWTHNLKDISYDPQFVPEGCHDSSPGVTMGAGVQFKEAYDFAEAHAITIMGGDDPGVGASGGWLQGGGHGGLSNTMGLGVDRVLQFKVVTPDGKYRIANACQNQDLFFALRGGGGGTFGVVMESTTLASPKVTLQAAAVIFSEPNITSTRALWTILVDNGVRWVREGWGGFINAESALWVTPTLNTDEARRSMEPLLAFGGTLKTDGIEGVQVIFAEFPSFGTFFNTFATGDNTAELGENLALASRLIPEENFQTPAAREELLSALFAAHAITPGVRLLAGSPFNFPGDGGTSVTDVWRRTIYHTTLIAPWNWDATLAEKAAQYQLASRAIDYLRTITPDAAYSNEADIHEPNHEVAFWGSNYDRLLQIKRKYDPTGLLDCWHCVGSQPSASQFSCYI